MQGVSVLMLGALAMGGGYSLLGTWAVGEWFGRPPEASGPGLARRAGPVSFFRPLKAGVPGLEGKLRKFLEALEPGDQVLFGVEAGSAEERICRALRGAFPEADIGVVTCEPDRAANPKISKLLQMEPHARHPHWLAADSEVLLDREFLTAFRAEWAAGSASVLSAGYRFEGVRTAAQAWDAAGVLAGLWPGMALVRRFGRINFALGACMLVDRAGLAAVGGWGAFGEYLAEDQRLGAALAAAGKPVALSGQVVSVESDPLTWRAFWRHQRRVAVTYRVANPAGFAGLILTQGLSVSLMVLPFLGRGNDWPLLAGAWLGAFLVRWACAALAARRLRFQVPCMPLSLFGLGIVETLCWVLAWASPTVWWAGRQWRVSPAGRLRPAQS